MPPLVRAPVFPQQTKINAGQVPARRGGPGIEFFGVRSYQAGDPLHHVNWRSTARYEDRLFSNEFEQERAAEIGLILDARSVTNVATPQGLLFEHQVAATAALAHGFLNSGNRVGLLIYGGFLDWTFPGYGKIQRERLMQSLARAKTGDSLIFSDLENLPTRAFPARSLLVLISPLIAEDFRVLVRLRARGYSLLVISPDPVAFETISTSLPTSPSMEMGARLARLERRLLFRRLLQAGVRVLDWDVSVPFEQVMAGMARRRAALPF